MPPVIGCHSYQNLHQHYQYKVFTFDHEIFWQKQEKDLPARCLVVAGSQQWPQEHWTKWQRTQFLVHPEAMLSEVGSGALLVVVSCCAPGPELEPEDKWLCVERRWHNGWFPAVLSPTSHGYGPTSFPSDHHAALCWPVESMIGWTQHSNKCHLPHEIAVDSSFLMNVHQLLFEIHMSCSVAMLYLVGHTLQATLSFAMLALIHQSHLGDWQPRTLYRLRKRGTDAQHPTPIHTLQVWPS